MTIEYAVKWVISGDSCVQNTQEFGSDISRNTAIPRRIKPKGSPISPPVLPVTYVLLIQGVNVDFFVSEFMGVSACSECRRKFSVQFSFCTKVSTFLHFILKCEFL